MLLHLQQLVSQLLFSDAPFYFANHGFIEGQMLVYEPNLDNYGTGAGNTALEGLTKGDIYFVSKGQDYFSLSESSSDAAQGTVIDLSDSAHGTAKTQFHQFKFKHISGLKQGTGTVGVSTVGNQSQLTGTGSKFLADVKIGDEVVIYDTTGSFTSSETWR